MKKTNSVRTPQSILHAVREEFGDVYDPCPYNPDFDPKIHKDGLKTEWGGVSFVNPPYSFVRPWFKKAREQWLLGKTVVLFIKLRNLGTQYVRKYISGAEIRIMVNKVQFPGYAGTALFNNVFVIFRGGGTQYEVHSCLEEAYHLFSYQALRAEQPDRHGTPTLTEIINVFSSFPEGTPHIFVKEIPTFAALAAGKEDKIFT